MQEADGTAAPPPPPIFATPAWDDGELDGGRCRSAADACGSYPSAPPLDGGGSSRTAKKRSHARHAELAALVSGTVLLGKTAAEDAPASAAAQATKKQRTRGEAVDDAGEAPPPSLSRKARKAAKRAAAAAGAPAASDAAAAPPPPTTPARPPEVAPGPPTTTAPARTKPSKKNKFKAGGVAAAREEGAGSAAPAPAPPSTSKAAAAAAADDPLARLRGRLAGGAFRWLNEALYTTTGAGGADLIGRDPALFEQYHAGFRAATKAWPAQPVERAAAALRARFAGQAGVAIADFGCGDAALANVHLAGADFTVTSLDLVADAARGIVAANTAGRVPLPSCSQHAVVICLALMGTDYPAMLGEAVRVLKPGGLLWVAEVRSRFAEDGAGGAADDTRPFTAAVCGRLGCRLARPPDAGNKMFVVFEFEKAGAGGGGGGRRGSGGGPAWPALRPCTYKRR